MKLNKLLIVTIVMLLSCLKSWSQNSNYNISLTGDSIMVAISDLRIVNTKLITAKYNAERLAVKDSIINYQNQKYEALNVEVKSLQDKLHNTNVLNETLKKDVEKVNKRNKILSGISGGAIAAFIVCLLIK